MCSCHRLNNNKLLLLLSLWFMLMDRKKYLTALNQCLRVGDTVVANDEHLGAGYILMLSDSDGMVCV